MQEIHIPTADEEAAAMLNAAAMCLREAQAKLSFGGDALSRERAKIIILVDEFTIRARALSARHQDRRSSC
ncbi:hypothetical protein A3H65_00440 [Candidatus Giovannonibacteria bacterium RIFCSPLOWO2_02_FULL_45_14]|uniref:Uncharacterized protein n=1 Tax=Candidatus Giovannonibacteria bacterium RIFCSPLOWO2_12_FULL_44_15 TaxID=1798364 RepID=A0A1F5XZ16_9BACT|nr:MAG: hypothetical protein A3C75_00020 [Candidatus Giovannonibacteria bacterium RIFCSPHIGHO2_02_FULL_44_31]OGF76757.1 MAG: hypothetical protein A3E62_04105 [Candidatus Giovannonibacteria bacterium RIFCSPHIGHO2_12_FULL_44_29]OGF91261.1 MAG: hypothetical protein A3H65_00440 [Candidatus Giovannonibacteria bacterium RIFCSPLOWO2_02_FULL_45_14]OGF93113.1 MAG: hypothetical protein A3G54_02525 [Candidatus Giovannonibacteria bacterium RIFCSPLOWO2_12_FULL_44_15]